MPAILLPLLDRAVHAALVRKGVRSSRVATPLGAIHAYDAPGRGPAPAIVLLHGLSASGGSYASMIARLRRRACRIVAPDLPGHGRSDEPTAPLTPERLFATMTAAL